MVPPEENQCNAEVCSWLHSKCHESLPLHRCSCDYVTSRLRLPKHKHTYILYVLRDAAILGIPTLCSYARYRTSQLPSLIAKDWVLAILHGIALPDHRNPSDMHAPEFDLHTVQDLYSTLR